MPSDDVPPLRDAKWSELFGDSEAEADEVEESEVDDDAAKKEAEDFVSDEPTARKLHFRPWLWLQLSKKTKHADTAKLILGGGPEGVWVGKPLNAHQVLRDIEAFYVSDRKGFDDDVFAAAQRTVDDYYTTPVLVEDVIKEKMRAGDATTKKRIEAGVVAVVKRVVADGDPESAEESMAGSDAPIDSRHPLRQVAKEAFVPGTLIPRMRCTHTERRPVGDWQCGRPAMPGAEVCDMHGGEWISLDETKALIKAGHDRLVLASETAISTVVDLMENGVNEAVRLKAAEMVLDRTGFVPGMEISVSGSGTETGSSPADILRERLIRLSQVPPLPEEEPKPAPDIVDAEIEEDEET